MRNHNNDQLILRHTGQIVLQPLQLSLGEHAVVGRAVQGVVAEIVKTVRIALLRQAGISDIVQDHEVHLADVKEVVISYVIGTAGTYWAIDRATGLFLT